MEKLAVAQAEADKLASVVVEISRKAGVDGRLFGSVTNADIADALKAQGFTIEKANIRMPDGPLKTVSETPIDISLHTDVIGQITVKVTGDN